VGSGGRINNTRNIFRAGAISNFDWAYAYKQAGHGETQKIKGDVKWLLSKQWKVSNLIFARRDVQKTLTLFSTSMKIN
jgi:hypothetical protein